MAEKGRHQSTPQRCNKHNKLRHDFFISYRVSTDHINAEKLAAHLDGKQRHDGTQFATYLDKNCLIQGKDWAAGFEYGIRHSNVILLLISQGLISTMVSKAKRGEPDNVRKEHKIALELIAEGRLVIPVYVATLNSTKSRRDCYIKLDHQQALRQFDGEGEAEEVRERLNRRRRSLETIFQLPASVNIEPDSISEKVPKIIQLWYAEFIKKKKENVGKCIPRNKDIEGVETNACVRMMKYPTQSFRMIFVGAFIGFFGTIFASSLFLMNSKSKKHTDLKFGVAIGNITSYIILILICALLGIRWYANSNKAYCFSCEVIVTERYSNDELLKYYNQIPYIDMFNATCTTDYSLKKSCNSDYAACLLQCICALVYTDSCQWDYNLSIFMFAINGVLVLIILGTVFLTNKFIRNESFAVSLTQ